MLKYRVDNTHRDVILICHLIFHSDIDIKHALQYNLYSPSVLHSAFVSGQESQTVGWLLTSAVSAEMNSISVPAGVL